MVQRTLDLRVLIGTVLFAGAVGATVYFVHELQVTRTAKSLKDLATVQEEKSEWFKAAQYLDRYVRLQPKDGPALGRLAVTYSRGAETYPEKLRAVSLHYRALAAADEDEARPLRSDLSGLLLDVGRFSEAEREASKLLQARPEDPPANRTLALALAAQLADGSLARGKYKELGIVAAIEKARQLNRSDIRVAAALASTYRNWPEVVLAELPNLTTADRNQRADATIDQLVGDNPRDSAAVLTRYLYRRQYNLPDAQADLDEALRLAPNDSEVLFTAAAQSLQNGQTLKQDPATASQAGAAFDKSRLYFEKLTGKPPKERSPAAFLGLGDAWQAVAQTDKAVAVWNDGLKQFQQPTTQATFHARIADALLDGNREDDAARPLASIDEILGKLATSVSRDARLALGRDQDLRRATWHIRKAEFAAALPLLRQVILRQPQGETRVDTTARALLLLGTVQFSMQEWVEAAAALDQAATLVPRMQQPRVIAANAYLMAGRPGIAAERAEQALTIGDTVDAWLALATAQFQQQLSLPARQRTWGRFEQALQRLESAQPQMKDARPWRVDFMRADYSMAQATQDGAASAAGKSATAAVLRAAEAKFASEKAFWLEVCQAYQNLGLSEDADRALEQFRLAGGSPVDVAIAQSRRAGFRKDFAAAITLLQAASKLASVADQQKLRGVALQLALASGDLDRAAALLLEEHRRQPANLAIIRRAAEIDLERRKLEQVVVWERKASEAGLPGAPLAGYLRAWRLYLSPDTDTQERLARLKQALHELEQVTLARPNWAEAASLKGLTALRLGLKDDAVKDLETAVQLGDRRVIVFEQLIALLDDLKRSADVERYLQRLEAEMPVTQRLAELAGNQELRRDRPEQAVEIARKGTLQRPSDPLAHLWLGRMLSIAGEPLEAEQEFEQAVQLGPEDPRVWNALLNFYTRIGNREQMRLTVDRLTKDTRLAPQQRTFLVAQAHELLGEQAAAATSYVEAATQSPGDLSVQLRTAEFHLRSNPQEAEKYARAALKIDEKSLAAKRLLVVALASQGEEGLREAEKLLGEGAAGGAAATEDQRLRALLLVQQGGPANLATAVKIVEDLLQNSTTPVPGDRLLLAQLYERQHQIIEDPQLAAAKLEQAVAELVQAADAADAQPVSIASLVQMLVRHRRLPEALPWLDKLQTSVDGQPETKADLLALVVQLQIQTKTTDRSATWLDRLTKADRNPLRPLVLQAQVLAAGDSQADIESLVEPKADELLKAAKTPADRVRLLSGIGELYVALKQYPAAERWYRRLTAEDPRQFPLLVGALAHQGRLVDAIALCEESAKTDDTTRPALVLIAALTEGSPQPEDFQKAEPLLSETAKKHASDASLLYGLSLIRLTEGRYDEAAKLYRKILTEKPRFVPALNNLAMLLAEQPDFRKEAVELIDQAIEIVGGDAGLLDTKGAILVYSSRSADALPLLVSATRGIEADPRHHFHLALAYRDQGRLEEAKTQLQTALDRKLESQVLMPIDRRLLSELRGALAL